MTLPATTAFALEALDETVYRLGIGDGLHDLQERESASLRLEGLL